MAGDDLEYGEGRMLETLYGREQMPFEVQVFINLEEVTRWIGVGRRLDGREDDRGKLNAHAAQALKRKGCRYGQVDALRFAFGYFYGDD